ncbi:protein kinase domain-containing protein [Kitasatospora sp. NBC_01302]|uniref:protein kinase domain-containing protein n=1 Tax=Kitasatospora sp. NBC_01302 TaxID=2903575 RepID=UPI002E0FE7A5|nr:protein kinase [Kitasatospora sp. NBC_01302]
MTTGESGRRLIDDRFELLQRLGGGGMGLVWRARDNALHREVALKEVRPPDPGTAATDPAEVRETRARVLREARALARLQHPNVVIIHHIVDTDEHPHPWLVMELVTGGSLADRLEQGPLTVLEAAGLGRGVLGALRAAHAVGIQHRDVKPGNVLLRPDGTPVLTDFGIAAMSGATTVTSTGMLIGSPEFMAPERIRGEEGNPASDLWSLGMMLYVAVEGHHPLRRASAIATLAAVLDEPLPPPARAGALGPLLAALLARDPAARPDAAQLDDALARLVHEAERGARPGGPTVLLTPPGAANSANSADSASAPGTPVADRVPAAAQRAAGGRRGGLIALAVALVAVAGVLGWTLRPGTQADGHRAGGARTTAGAPSGLPAASPPVTDSPVPSPPTAGPSASATPASAPVGVPKGFAPADVRATIAAMSPTMGGTKVFRLTVYPDYANADVPVAANPQLYDQVEYRDGRPTRSPGGTEPPVVKPVDLQGFDWDKLPALFQQAQATLKVPAPNEPYLTVSADIITGAPTLDLYLTNTYGGGYLEISPTGNVLRTYPLGG